MALYRIIMALLAPLLLARALWRGESRVDVEERLGHGAAPCDLWLHGASLGELTSARWLVAALQADRPGLTVLVTANTLTGRQMVRDWQMPGVTARLAPLDLRGALRRFLRASGPKALLSLEAEYWPLRFAACADREIPVVLLGARMSERSFRRWQNRSAIAATMLGAVQLASAQDAASRRHLLQLGLPTHAVQPDLDLKAQAMAHQPTPVTPDRAARETWLLAASTHQGEEALVLAAFARQSRFTHLIVAPRHPDRGAEIATLLHGTDFARRSQGAEPGGTRIYLADTLGEMDRWYATCGAVVIGGSFAPRGGHTPWEPAHFGTAMLHGPDTRNFAAAFAALDDNLGAIPVTADTLHAALVTLDGPSQDRIAAAATAVLQADGDIFALLERIRVISGY